ncbi:MAG: FtsQ-type POTRA domain-containing protein [Candidatus Cloacimonetes bacterium]|nr:FtsQ-type POTRA domain-containing protein [Candidatus Cloacimonadota bacterium]
MIKKRSGSSRYFFIFLIFALLIYGSYWGINSLFTKLDIFNVKSISITGNSNLETDFLLNICSDLVGKNLYSISKLNVRKKYENIVRINDIKVTRIFPDKLKIRIIETKGEFFIRTQKGCIFPIDQDRIVLDNVNFYNDEILPVIDTKIPDPDIVIGSKLINELVEEVFLLKSSFDKIDPTFIKSISEFYKSGEDIVFVNANIGYRIVLGSNEIEEKLGKLNFLEQNRSFEKGTTIDLRFKDQLVIRAEEL